MNDLNPETVPHPPTSPFVPTPPPVRSKWPTVIGLLLLLYGGLFSLCGIIGELMQRAGMKYQFLPASQPDFGRWSSYIAASKLVGYLMLFALAVAGLGILVRRRWSVSLVKGWSILQILISLVSSVISFMSYQELSSIVQQNTPQVLSPQSMEAIMFGSMCVGILIGLGVPVFLLTWFSRRAIRLEVNQWP